MSLRILLNYHLDVSYLIKYSKIKNIIMEKLNKTKSFNDNVLKTNKTYYNKELAQISENSFYEGLDYAEQHYLKIIEFKDDFIIRLQDRRNEMQSEAERLKQELQQAKELLSKVHELKGHYFTSMALYNKVEQFLNKQ